MPKFFHFFIIFFLGGCIYSQTPSFNFQKLGSEEGLNNSNIFSIDQHQNGLMYFTTQNGIYYYDGYVFNKLEIDSLKSNALLGATIKNKDELFLSIGGEGIANYHLGDKNYKLLPGLKLKENNADNFIVTEKFAYLLTWSIKLVLVDLQSGQTILDEVKANNTNNLAYCIFKTKSGKILAGRSDGLYDVTSGKQIKLDVLKNIAVHSICENHQGKLIVGSTNKIFILNQLKIEKEIIPTYYNKGNAFQMGGVKSVDKVISDIYGRIWFTSFPNENLYLYQNNKVYDVFELLDIQPMLINCVYKDNSENIWIGTFNDGVYYIQNPFFTCLNFSFNNKSLNVNQVYLKKNLLMAATSNGLFGLSLSSGSTKILSKPDEIFTESINDIIEMNNEIYYTKRSEYELKPSLFFDSQYSYKIRPIIAKQIFAIDQQKVVLADWNSNVILTNSDATKVLDTLLAFEDYRISVNSFFKKNQLLYIATNKGLYTYDFSTKKSKHLIRPELNYNINDVTMINKKVYVAHEAGITNVETGQLIQEIGNLRLNSVKKIKQHQQLIWLATLDGVIVCSKDLQPIKRINRASGLLSNSVNDITFSESIICISTAKGIAYTSIANVMNYNDKLKPVLITSVAFHDEKLVPKNNQYNFTNEMENVNITFLSTFFNKPNKQFYKWRNNGESWNYINNPSFDIALSGGPHLIEISASIDNINWSYPTQLKINKEAKLSEKQLWYWFLTSMIAGIILLISFIWIRRVKMKSKRRLKDEQQVNLLKHQAMNALLSPHFIFNSLTSIQNYINTNNGLKASEYLAKFSRLIRMIIEKAAQSEISLQDEITRLSYYLELEKERFKNKFDYKIEVDENISLKEIMIPNMIIQPHVENSIIHGILPKQAHGELSVSFKINNAKNLIITIEDNGIGLIKARELAKAGHKSIGTQTIQSILEINSKLSGKKQNVKMFDKSELINPSNGTLITIEIEL